MVEAMHVLEWLATVLASASSGGVWRGIAPLNTSTPYIVANVQSAPDVAGVAGIRLMNNGLYLIKAVGPANNTQAILASAEAIDTAIQRQHNIVSNGITIAECVREQIVMFDELVNNEQWTSIGGLYRIYVITN